MKTVNRRRTIATGFGVLVMLSAAAVSAAIGGPRPTRPSAQAPSSPPAPPLAPPGAPPAAPTEQIDVELAVDFPYDI